MKVERFIDVAVLAEFVSVVGPHDAEDMLRVFRDSARGSWPSVAEVGTTGLQAHAHRLRGGAMTLGFRALADAALALEAAISEGEPWQPHFERLTVELGGAVEALEDACIAALVAAAA